MEIEASYFDNFELRYDTYLNDGTRKCFQNRDDITMEAHGSNSTCHVERNVNAKRRVSNKRCILPDDFLSTHTHLTRRSFHETSIRSSMNSSSMNPECFQAFVMHTVKRQMFEYLLVWINMLNISTYTFLSLSSSSF